MLPRKRLFEPYSFPQPQTAAIPPWKKVMMNPEEIPSMEPKYLFNNPMMNPNPFQPNTVQFTSMLLQRGYPPKLFFTPLPQNIDWALMQQQQQAQRQQLDRSALDEVIPVTSTTTVNASNTCPKMTTTSSTIVEPMINNVVDDDDDMSAQQYGLRGEKRLVIHFESFGILGSHGCPQTCCRVQKCVIPDGLCGTHKMYGEHWKFRITHTDDFFQDKNSFCVCLLWEVTNLSTGKISQHRESHREASLRMKRGDTVSSKLFRSALEAHAEFLEKQLALWDPETHANKILQINNKIRALRPKKFSEGTLVFGLQHSIVQQKIRALNKKEFK